MSERSEPDGDGVRGRSPREARVSDDVDAALAQHGAALAELLVAALPDWSARSVIRFDPGLEVAGRRAGAEAAAALGPELRQLLAADVDDQRANPLAVVRQAVRWPTEVLREAGVPPVERDPVDEGNQPDDVYGLAPMRFADVDESLHEPGLVWGALKARAHLRRHRARSARGGRATAREPDADGSGAQPQGGTVS